MASIRGISMARVALSAALCLVLGATPVAGQTAAAQQPSLGSPLQPVAGDTAEIGVAVRLDPQGYAALKGVEPFRMTGFVLAPDRVVDLELECFDIFSADARLVAADATGEKPLPRPDVLLLRGSVAGAAGSRVFLALSPLGSNGYVLLDEQTFIVATAKVRDEDRTLVYDLTNLPPGAIQWRSFVCGNDLLPDGGRVAPFPPEAPDPSGPQRSPTCRTVRVAIETDWEYRTVFSSTAAATTYATTLLGAVSEKYLAEVNARLEIPFLRVWLANNDPYSATTVNDRLYEFRDYWNANMGYVTRNVAHLLSGLSGGGVAWLRVLCSGSYSYGVSGSMHGSFPYPLQNNNAQNWDVYVVAHELGHNFDAIHTHEMSPPIDCCGGAYGGNCGGVQNCASPVPANQGTIMSYCHTCSGGVANIVLTLQTRVINERILPYLNGAADACLLRDPAITQHPLSQTACEGAGVTFTVTATGTPLLTYQWRRNGSAISGATASTYTITSVTPAQAGSYDCVVTNAPVCSVTSNAATLTVFPGGSGDGNGDGATNGADIQGFVNAVIAGGAPGPTYCAYDMNGDGAVDAADIPLFVTRLVNP